MTFQILTNIFICNNKHNQCTLNAQVKKLKLYNVQGLERKLKLTLIISPLIYSFLSLLIQIDFI